MAGDLRIVEARFLIGKTEQRETRSVRTPDHVHGNTALALRHDLTIESENAIVDHQRFRCCW
jgi:hypothetical protein